MTTHTTDLAVYAKIFFFFLTAKKLVPALTSKLVLKIKTTRSDPIGLGLSLVRFNVPIDTQ